MLNSKHNYFEVGNGSRRTLQRVPEMMDTPPIQNNCAFIFVRIRVLAKELHHNRKSICDTNGVTK